MRPYPSIRLTDCPDVADAWHEARKSRASLIPSTNGRDVSRRCSAHALRARRRYLKRLDRRRAICAAMN